MTAPAYDVICAGGHGVPSEDDLGRDGACSDCRSASPCSVCRQYAPHACDRCTERLCAVHAIVGERTVFCAPCNLAEIEEAIEAGAAELVEALAVA